MRSANDKSARNARHENMRSMRHRKLVSELSARSGMLMRGGVMRRGRGLRVRRCAGAR